MSDFEFQRPWFEGVGVAVEKQIASHNLKYKKLNKNKQSIKFTKHHFKAWKGIYT